MDGTKFDALAKGLATGRTRRSVLKGLIGGSAAVVATKTGTALAGPGSASLVTICHATGSTTNPYVEIQVAQQAVEQHLQKNPGDAVGACECVPVPVECTPDACGELYDNCGNFIQDCTGGCCNAIECASDACGPQLDTCGNVIGDCTGGCCVPEPTECGPEDCGDIFDNCGNYVDTCTGGCGCGQVDCAGQCGRFFDDCGNAVNCYNTCTCIPIQVDCTPGVNDNCCVFDGGSPCQAWGDCFSGSTATCC
jgi:hypothetical protein